MIALTPQQLAHIRRAAERAYPDECCGLLVGQAAGDGVRVTRIVDSPNIRVERARDRFEIDPQVRFDLERSLRGGEERIVGHFHSHPDHPARPSATDLAMAFEPALVWIIVSVAAGEAGDVRAFKLDETANVFAETEIESVTEPRS